MIETVITYIFSARDAHPASTATTASTAAARHASASLGFNPVRKLRDIDFALSLGSGDDGCNANSLGEYGTAFWVTRVVDSEDARTEDEGVKMGTVRERGSAEVASGSRGKCHLVSVW